MTPIFRRRRGRARAFTLIEVALSLIVFLMMTLVFAAVFPMALSAAKLSDNYSQAAQIAQHKIDQMRAAGFSGLNYAGLLNASIIDPIAPPAGQPTVYHFESVDNVVSNGTNSGYFPPGSTATITIQDYNAYATAKGVSSGLPPAGAVDYVTVTLTWAGGGARGGTYSTSAMIIQMKHT
jgi:type II secretory pathway pseudopilin PulG